MKCKTTTLKQEKHKWQSRNAGKCRFPLVPDNGFDEEDVIETNFEEQPVQAVTYENEPVQRGIKVERSRRQYVEKVVSTYEEPEMQYEPGESLS